MSYKVLYFVDYFAVGGIQNMLYNLLKAFDGNIIQCEYLVLDDKKEYEYEGKFEADGGKIYKLNDAWINSLSDIKTYCKSLDDFFKQHHDYQAVHVNASSKNFMVLYYAKKYGIKKRIIHSHNTGFQTHSPLKTIVGNIMKLPMKHYATDYFACSRIAGEWLFGKKMVEQGKVHIIPNGINLDKYGFNEDVRNAKREELGIENDYFVVGHIGRFSMQKNHKFVIDIFAKVHELNPKSVLLLVGDGELRSKCEVQVKNLNIVLSVKFLGFRDDVPELVQAMDIMLMPSFHEGFPVTAVETQASGCPCLFADTITAEAKLLDSTEYMSLEESAETWANKLFAILDSVCERNESRETIKAKGFDIDGTARFLEKYYLVG